MATLGKLTGGGGLFDQNIKILLIGDSGVGKTSLMLRYTDNTFATTYLSTVGIDFKYKLVRQGDKKVRLEIWDTAGQERFKSITTSYMRGAQGIIICFDVTNRDTFLRVDQWLHDVHDFADLKVDKVLVATKADLESKRAVLQSEGAALADAYGMKYFEVSAKSELNVAAPFDQLTKAVMERLNATAVHNGTKGVSISAAALSKSAGAQSEAAAAGGCCGGGSQ